MISIKNKLKTGGLALFGLMVFISSCNKEIVDFPVETPMPSAGLALAETLAATPDDSLFYKIVRKNPSLITLLNNKASQYTLLVPNNAAMIASLGGSLATANAAINAMSTTTATLIVQYNLLPGLQPSSQFTSPFPNRQLPTSVVLDPTNSLVRMTTFFGRNNNFNYVNNIPVGVVDVQVANGIIHKPLALVAPPSRVLKDTLSRVANLTLFMATIAKADSGQIGLNRFDSLLNYGVTNMTVLAPDNNAIKSLIVGLSGGLVPPIAPDAAFISFINNNVPAALARGIVAYHLLASPNAAGAIQPNIRVFSVNVPTTSTFIKTAVNASVAAHPGVMAQATFTGPVVSSLKFTGLGTFPPGGAPFSGPAANVTGMDRHAVNGVFHIIDRVLLPQ